MITRERLEEVFEHKKPYQILKDVDHDQYVMTLLRTKIPYERCKSIIQGARYDVVILCDVNIAIEFITNEDALVLADCNVWIDSDWEALAIFV